MPTKQVGDFKLAFISQDGTITVFGDATEIIEECPTDCYFDTSKDPAYLATPELTFTATCNCNLKSMYLLVHGLMPTSNWLRMHRMKPKRKDSHSKKGRGSMFFKSLVVMAKSDIEKIVENMTERGIKQISVSFDTIQETATGKVVENVVKITGFASGPVWRKIIKDYGLHRVVEKVTGIEYLM